MSKDTDLELNGIITAVYGGKFEVEYKMGNETFKSLCTVAGKMNKNKIKVVLGDNVLFTVSGYDNGAVKNGRITRRQ